MTYILFLLIVPFFIHEKLRTPFHIEYRSEFTKCPSKSKKLVWTLRRITGLYSSETLEINKDKEVIELALLNAIKAHYALTDESKRSKNLWVILKLKVAFYYTSVNV
jgi:hypothetical protein